MNGNYNAILIPCSNIVLAMNSKHCKRAILTAALIILTFSGNRVIAWEYAEHGNITYTAFDELCEDLNSTGSRLVKYCNKIVMECYAHMVALAGDYADKPTELADENEFPRFHKSVTDDKQPEKELLCGDLSSRIEGAYLTAYETRQKEKPGKLLIKTIKEDGKLVSSFFRKHIEYANLASTNGTHFQPESAQEWKKYINRVDENSTMVKLTNHAFSTHYLQDSFSAGHIGLDRNGNNQDYSQAYHDDINKIGQFVGSDSMIWFTYGDGSLEKKTKYLRILEPSNVSYTALIKDINSAHDISDGIVYRYETSTRVTIEDEYGLDTTVRSPSTGSYKNVISLESIKNNNCHIFDQNCEIRQFVLIEGTNDIPKCHTPFINGRSCKCLKDIGNTEVYECSTTLPPVLKATKDNIHILLKSLQDKAIKTEPEYYQGLLEDVNRVNNQIPNRYLPPTPNSNKLSIYYPKYPVERRADEINDNGFGSSRFGIGASTTLTKNNSISLSTIDISIDTSSPFPFNATIEFYNVNDELWFNGLSYNYKLESKWRPFRKILGTNLLTGIGVSNWWWWTPSHANYYATLGGQVNFHAGKNIVYVNISTRLNSNDDIPDQLILQVGYAYTNIEWRLN